MSKQRHESSQTNPLLISLLVDNMNQVQNALYSTVNEPQLLSGLLHDAAQALVLEDWLGYELILADIDQVSTTSLSSQEDAAFADALRELTPR